MKFLLLLLVLLVLGCERERPPPTTISDPGELKNFTGKWTATGTRQTMQLEPGNEAVIFRLTGSLLLSGKERLNKGFKADAIGFFDSKSGLQGRTVWTDEHGDKVFSELHAESGDSGRLIKGKFLGGTGRYATADGGFTFKWKRLVNNENGEISGRTDDLKGWVRLGAASTTQATMGDQQ